MRRKKVVIRMMRHFPGTKDILTLRAFSSVADFQVGTTLAGALLKLDMLIPAPIYS